MPTITSPRPRPPFTTRALLSAAREREQQLQRLTIRGEPYDAKPKDPDSTSQQQDERTSLSSAELDALLPATFRNKDDTIVLPRKVIPDFLEADLEIERLYRIRKYWWVCGRPMPPRPLHKQVLLSRELIVTENPELHLVWKKKRMWLKPIPRYLLEPRFWTAYILPSSADSSGQADNLGLDAWARGFLYTWTALIQYESDFKIAQAKGLLSPDVSWLGWQTLSQQLLDSHSNETIHPRYWYGELRLGRLDLIYNLRGLKHLDPSFFRGYSSVDGYSDYSEMLRTNFTTLALILGYMGIVLAAMQVGLAVDQLTQVQSFQNASYGFTVFSMIGPLAMTVSILIFSFVLVLFNVAATRQYQKRRFFKQLQVMPDWLRPDYRSSDEKSQRSHV